MISLLSKKLTYLFHIMLLWFQMYNLSKDIYRERKQWDKITMTGQMTQKLKFLFSTQKYMRNVVLKIQVILILYITTSHVQRLELTY